MAQIGLLTRNDDDSFDGTLEMKSYNDKVRMIPVARKATDRAPDYRLYGRADNGKRFDMGAAWVRTKTDGQGTYISLKIDFPELPAPVYATLGQAADQDDADVLAIIWNRPETGR